MPSLSSALSSKKSQSAPGMDNSKNYWRLDSLSPSSPPERPPSYLLQPHLIASSMCSDENNEQQGIGGGKNPNSKYYKLRHGPGACQFSPLNEDLIGYHQYRVRLPFDPSPFRGASRFLFWIVFLSILAFLSVLITSLLRVEDIHAQQKYVIVEDGNNFTHDNINDYHHRNLGQRLISSDEDHFNAGRRRDSLNDSLLFKALSSNSRIR